MDEVTNDSATPTEMQMLYHFNIGQPLLSEGAKAVLPLRQLVPRDAHAAKDIDTWDVYRGPDAGYSEQCYFTELAADKSGRSMVLLKNADASQGVSLQFGVKTLPYFVLWKNTRAVADGYVTGLEPSTNFPHERSFETKHGRVVKLAPGESVRFELQITAYGDRAAVANAEKAVQQLQSTVEPQIHSQPRADWTPGIG